jgi:hypothetical protein
LIPWQYELARLTGERLPDGTLAYRRCVAIVPRRAGKSMLMLAKGLATIRTPGARAYYTSAHRENAARMCRDDWFATIDASPLARYTAITRGNGTEAIRFRRVAGASFRLVAASRSAIAGAATALVVVDEARDIPADLGAELEAAVFPTQATGAGGQTWIVSSAGDESSLWLARWRELGRAAVDAGRRDGIAYIEFAADPDADPDDETVWWSTHPGLGFHVNVDALRADAAVMEPAAFAAEYLGIWPASLVDSVFVDAWARTESTAALVDPVTFALEVDEDRTTAVIVAAAADDAGRVQTEVIDHRPHGTWILPRLLELCARWDPAAVVWDAAGPAAALGVELAEVPTRTVALGVREMIAAAGSFYDRVIDGTITHRRAPEFDAAIPAARRRRAGGAWLWDRRIAGSGPLIAAAAAVWVHRNASARPPTIT